MCVLELRDIPVAHPVKDAILEQCICSSLYYVGLFVLENFRITSWVSKKSTDGDMVTVPGPSAVASVADLVVTPPVGVGLLGMSCVCATVGCCKIGAFHS